MKVFEFLGIDLHERGERPRQTGFTSVIDAATPLPVLEAVLEAHGQYIDLIKPTGQFLVSQVDHLRERVALVRSHGIAVQPSGIFLEVGRLQGRGAEVLQKLRELGFTHVEVSSSATDLNTAEDDHEFTKLCLDMGFTAVGEVGKKFPDGDRTRLAEDRVDVEVTVREMQAFIDLGVEHVYWEGNILRKVIGESPEEVEAKAESAHEQIHAVTGRVPVEHLVFEVTSLIPGPVRRMLQQWFIREFGPDVNLGNIPPGDVASVEMMRRGTMVVHGLGSAGDHPWVRSLATAQSGEQKKEWWRG